MKILTRTAAKTARGKGMTIVWGKHPFPVGGHLLVALSAKGLCWVGIGCDEKALRRNWRGAEFVEDQKITAPAAREITKLWPGKFDRFSLPLDLAGTAFQLKVWKALLKVPSGKTCAYADIAKKIGSPKAVRAVGAAVGANPVALLVPCHRVIHTAKGAAPRYAFGPAVKKALLAGEQ
jgi:AraC family transcriptional regulator, regulatory protein of adaptative response / methylated-DNA-[protein]-cysteine methyltransferase